MTKLITTLPSQLRPPFARGWVLGHKDTGYRFTIVKNNTHYFLDDEVYKDKYEARAAMLSYINTINARHQQVLDNYTT